MLRILSREGARPQVSRFFFKYVVQSVLLFGAETWVVNPCIRRVLGRFPRPGGADTDWEYSTAEAGRKVEVQLGGSGDIGGGV